MVVEIVGAREGAKEEGAAAELEGLVVVMEGRHSKKPGGGGGGAMP
jgi:hypothetical protein